MKSIKKKPDDSLKFSDEVLEHLDPQKYYYKEELNLEWDEKDNNYDENYDTFVRNPTEESKEKSHEQNTSLLQNRYSQQKEINNKIEQLENKTKESFIVGPIENSKAQSIKENTSISILQENCFVARKRNLELENSESEKDRPKCRKRMKNLNTLNKHLIYGGKATYLHCDCCSYKTKYKNTLVIHIMRHHPKHIQNLQKKKTTKKITSKSNVYNDEQQNDNSHQLPRTHSHIEAIKWKKIEEKNTTDHVYTCPSCGKQYQRKSSLTGHMRCCIKSQGMSKPSTYQVENQKRKKGVQCTLSRHCAKCNSKIQSNDIQMSNCCGSSILLKCLKCKKSSKHHKSMKHHEKGICFKSKCEMCDYEGPAKSVAAHRRQKHDVNSVECPNCKIKLQNENQLQSHLHHCGKESLNCDYCAFKSKIGSILRVHILQNHSM